MAHDASAVLIDAVKSAAATQQALLIQGGQSKAWYGRSVQGQVLSVQAHCGILDYQPSELFITARAGTLLSEIEATLAEHGQMLACESPQFAPSATLGGTLACGLSGPRRPYAGAVRDFVLGVELLDGRGQVLRFGGQVMKNVAGYDVSRLLCGSLGTLGVILSASLKVLPKPAASVSLSFEYDAERAIRQCNLWAGQALPLSASAYLEGCLYLRLEGARSAVQSAQRQLGGTLLSPEHATTLWHSLREHTHAFFEPHLPLWRLSLPAATAPQALPGRCLVEWGGTQRWLYSDLPAAQIRAAALKAGGHATLFRGGDRDSEVFTPLNPALLAVQQRLKHSFDPQGLFNPGRLYSEL